LNVYKNDAALLFAFFSGVQMCGDNLLMAVRVIAKYEYFGENQKRTKTKKKRKYGTHICMRLNVRGHVERVVCEVFVWCREIIATKKQTTQTFRCENAGDAHRIGVARFLHFTTASVADDECESSRGRRVHRVESLVFFGFFVC